MGISRFCYCTSVREGDGGNAGAGVNGEFTGGRRLASLHFESKKAADNSGNGRQVMRGSEP